MARKSWFDLLIKVLTSEKKGAGSTRSAAAEVPDNPFFDLLDDLLDEIDGRLTVDSDAEPVYNIVGESHYQDALAEIVGGKSETGHYHSCMAELVPVSVEADRSAVSVQIDGKRVGFLRRTDAKLWRAALKQLGHAGKTVRAPARIVGGWDRMDGKKRTEGVFGVKLCLDLDI